MENETETLLPVGSDDLVVPLRRRTPSAIGLIALTAMLAGAGMYLPGGGGPSGQSIRNDPDREKTPEDLRKLEAARLKRERKAAKHSRHNSELSQPNL
jgi:hypothetical protein